METVELSCGCAVWAENAIWHDTRKCFLAHQLGIDEIAWEIAQLGRHGDPEPPSRGVCTTP